MERDDGFMFDCRIPPFSLESKQDDPTTNGGDPNGPTIIGNQEDDVEREDMSKAIK